MMKNREYFEQHVVMAVEVEMEYGGRYWNSMPGSKVREYCERIANREDAYVSDLDYSCKQDDEWVRRVLNTADYNWRKNSEWCKSRNLTSLQKVICYIIDNRLVA